MCQNPIWQLDGHLGFYRKYFVMHNSRMTPDLGVQYDISYTLVYASLIYQWPQMDGETHICMDKSQCIAPAPPDGG